MTTIQKKAAIGQTNPTAHLDAEDIEQLGARARRDPRSRSSTPAARATPLHPQGDPDPAQARARQPRRAAGLAVPAGVARRHRRPLGRQDPGEHGDRPQRPARPVGLDARPEDPLDHLGVGHTPPRPSSGSTRHNELHHTYTNVIGKDNDLGYGIMRVDEDQPWHPVYLGQPLWNFINACFFEYGIAAYDLELGKNLKRGKQKSPKFRARGQGGAEQDPQAGRPRTTSSTRCCPARRRPDHAGREPHRQPRPQPLDALGDHVRPLPRGRRRPSSSRSIEGETRGRVVPAPDARLGQHLRLAS